MRLAPDSGALTRRARKKERTRRELYAAAVGLFLRRGFDAVTVEEICNAADVARATFFLHFPGKHAVLREYGRQVTDDVATALAAHRGSAASALRRAVAVLADRAQQHRRLMPLLLHDTLSRPEGTRETTEQGRDLAALLATVVQRGQEAGELRAEVDARVAAAVLVSGYFAVASEWIRQDDAFDLRAAAGQVLELVLGGLRVPAVRRRRRPREET